MGDWIFNHAGPLKDYQVPPLEPEDWGAKQPGSWERGGKKSREQGEEELRIWDTYDYAI